MWALVPPGGREGKIQEVASRRLEGTPCHCVLEPTLTLRETVSTKGESSRHTHSDATACLSQEARETGSIPGWARSPREGNSPQLQCPCLERFLDRQPGQLWSRCAESDTAERLSTHALMLNSFVHF